MSAYNEVNFTICRQYTKGLSKITGRIPELSFLGAANEGILAAAHMFQYNIRKGQRQEKVRGWSPPIGRYPPAISCKAFLRHRIIVRAGCYYANRNPFQTQCT